MFRLLFYVLDLCFDMICCSLKKSNVQNIIFEKSFFPVSVFISAHLQYLTITSLWGLMHVHNTSQFFFTALSPLPRLPASLGSLSGGRGSGASLGI